MVRSTLAETTFTALTSNGFNLTDASFTTMSTGAGNGLTFTHSKTKLLILKNDTGGAATVDFILASVSSVTAVGGSLTDPQITIADLKTHLMPVFPDILKDSSDLVKFDCDVALKALLVDFS